ncbi:MAG: NADH-quinone oxidoreductase subunit L [Anaerolineae bacterium]
MLDYVWLVLVFPALGVLINGFFSRRLGRKLVGYLACIAVGLSFVVSLLTCWALIQLPPESRSVEVALYTWTSVSDFAVDFTLLVDPLSIVMMLVITGVGFLIHIYSIGYMHDDPGYGRYFTYLNLFILSMSLLVLGNNFLMLYAGWELVGLCSYLLIGFWYQKKSAADAGRKAFVVTRIGDFAFALAILIIFANFGTLAYKEVFERAPELLPAGGALVTLITLLLFAGATGKSAQIPLYVWLPDAMEGPTPVSALIHAATMVTAGVYMIARTHVLYELAPLSMSVVAVIGAITAFFAATIALVQNDIKRVLAYSTISQLGYMFMAMGVGAYASGMFHLTTHAFFKALLFLCAGSVMHSLAGELDMRKMGGLKDKMRTTYRAFMAGAAALAGFPLLSGFFSKDEILWRAFNSSIILWLVGIVTALLTSFYAFRAVFLTFWGESRVDEKVAPHVHESPRVMTIPLTVLAVLAIIGGLIGIPHLSAIEGFLEPVFASHETAHASGILEWVLMALSGVVAIVAIILAQYMYLVNPGVPGRLSERYASLYKLLSNKYYVDEIYGAIIVKPFMRLSAFVKSVLEDEVVDGTVDRVAFGVGGASRILRHIQTGYLRSYALAVLMGVVLIVGYFILR